MKVVKVKWVDSLSDNGRWTLKEDIDDYVAECVSYGWLVTDNDNYITIALNRIAEPEQYCQMISIPKCAVIELTDIEDV